MLTPPSDRVILRQRAPEERTAGGVYLPETAQEDSLFCEVVAVGTEKVAQGTVERLPHDMRPGDVVIIPRGAGGTEITMEDGDTVISILAEQVLAVVTG